MPTTTLKVLVPTKISLTTQLLRLIEEKFERGGNSQFQINDVLEEDLSQSIMKEAEALLFEHGEFYIQRHEVLGE